MCCSGRDEIYLFVILNKGAKQIKRRYADNRRHTDLHIHIHTLQYTHAHKHTHTRFYSSLKKNTYIRTHTNIQPLAYCQKQYMWSFNFRAFIGSKLLNHRALGIAPIQFFAQGDKVYSCAKYKKNSQKEIFRTLCAGSFDNRIDVLSLSEYRTL